MKGDRYMSIIVKSNSTEPLLALWVRQIPPSDLRYDPEATALQIPDDLPMPQWLLDGVTGQASMHSRRLLTCMPADILSYTVRVRVLQMHTGTDGGVTGQAYRDLERCRDPNNEKTCFYNFKVDLGKGPFKSIFWIGVQGAHTHAHTRTRIHERIHTETHNCTYV